MAPQVVFGMTLYNNARHLPAALESLLSQADTDFGLVMVDDASADGTEEVARAWVARDPRLRYVRHARRRGMVPTWRDAFDEARRQFPSASYFAWASDHDWWHPEWLFDVRRALEQRPGAVLGYAQTQRVDDDLQPLDKPPKTFDTTTLEGPAARVLAFAGEPAGAGDMVYGLVRIEALERAGVFRRVIQPDRLLMVELALAGSFVQVPRVLWLRRQPAQPSVVKQRATLFTEGEAPWWLGLPAWIQHSVVLVRQHGGPWLVTRYQATYLVRHLNKQGSLLHRLEKAGERIHQGWKEIRHLWRHAVYETLMFLRPRHLMRLAQRYSLHFWRAGIYQLAVARRRARAVAYETRMAVQKQYGRLRRSGRKARYELAMLTHRLGFRGRS